MTMGSLRKKRVVFIVSRFPYPLEKGDKLRAFHQLRTLAKWHEVHLISLTEQKPDASSIAEVKKHAASLHILPLPLLSMVWQVVQAWIKGLPLQVGYFYNCRHARKIKHILAEIQPDHIYAQLIRTSEYVKHADYPKTLDYQDVFSTGALRQSRKARGWMRWVFRMESKRLKSYEAHIFPFFDHHSIISEPDRDLIPHHENHQIHVIPNGVDTSYFEYDTSILKDNDVLFTGNMAYPPNVDACRFLVRDIMPIVWKTRPGTHLIIAGAAPAPEVKALADSRVEVTGWMDDIRSAYARSRVFIAPMRIGTGLQNKLLEAMAMELPCITTSLAAAALAEKREAIQVADTADDLAQHILKLLAHPDEALQLGKRGREYVGRHYDWDATTKRLSVLMFPESVASSDKGS